MIEPQGNSSNNSYGELSVLREFDDAPETTQRGLSARLGISLGLANLLVKRVVGKGYVTVTRSGWRRRLYYLTPSGAAQKVSLTAAYVSRFLDEYRRVRIILEQELSAASFHRESRVALYGTGRLAELVYLAIKDIGVESIDVYDSDSGDHSFLGMTVGDISGLRSEDYERVVIADLDVAELVSATLNKQGVPAQRIVWLLTPTGASAGDTDAFDVAAAVEKKG